MVSMQHHTVARLEGELASVDALKELKYELIQQKQVIIVHIMSHDYLAS